MKLDLSIHGYYRVGIYDEMAKQITHSVHRLVAKAFLPVPTDDLIQVDHINGVKTDNRAINLRWVARSQNLLFASKMGLLAVGERHYKAKLTEDAVRSIRLDPRPLGKIAADYGVSKGLISQVKKRKIWKHVLDVVTGPCNDTRH